MNSTEQKRGQARGLSREDVLRSRREHGANVITKKKGKSFARQFLSNLNDPVIRILLCALAVNLFLVTRGADWIETAGIADTAEAGALRERIGELFRRAKGTMN